ncbi:hypothetical protein Q4603_05680 [Zobellia galactanivorans]|uniref:hypothetical protein n=1 Tax=Zobellia galactanivorans (strain DSM 12802 / CCUG 47099 / CIP 106680 / NCIMB 13871 / Dsij) TaxID=63186 RepID=UPI0026E158E2|nr:hypothetical protein [Zobellia galactanivorans]MDO6808085.1 hypothetical protein [Zobellia galactanivorans]
MVKTENPAVERRAAENILQRGVKFKIAAPWYIRWFKKTITLKVKSPYYGTLMRASAYYLSTGLKDHQIEDVTVEQSVALMSVHGKALSKAVAVSVLNGKWKGLLFTKPLARYLRWHMTAQEMCAIVTMLLVYGGTSDFMNTTRSVRLMKATTPKLGQKVQGS